MFENINAVWLILSLLLSTPQQNTQPVSTTTYSWKATVSNENKLANRIPTPDSYQRMTAAKNSFAEWLRYTPLKAGKPDVLLYNGELKGNQHAHFAVIDMDAGNKDLQQCADAVMRLRAEYLFAQKQYDSIHFKFTSGFNCSYAKWREGYRTKVNGNNVTWVKTASPDNSYAGFKKYLETVFSYCGSKSLSGELKQVTDPKRIKPGDVFIRGGFPGHAVIVMDVAQNSKGEKVFLLAQSYMPAQEMHILKNPNNAKSSPWYHINEVVGELITPEWTFSTSELMEW